MILFWPLWGTITARWRYWSRM